MLSQQQVVLGRVNREIKTVLPSAVGVSSEEGGPTDRRGFSICVPGASPSHSSVSSGDKS